VVIPFAHLIVFIPGCYPFSDKSTGGLQHSRITVKLGKSAHTPVKTALPANIEDEDLDDSRPLHPQPPSKRTKISYQLARLKFIEFTYKQICQANNKAMMSYSEV
jgi:hypothetical protein